MECLHGRSIGKLWRRNSSQAGDRPGTWTAHAWCSGRLCYCLGPKGATVGPHLPLLQGNLIRGALLGPLTSFLVRQLSTTDTTTKIQPRIAYMVMQHSSLRIGWSKQLAIGN